MPKKWYSTKETCERLQIHRNTLRTYREKGFIPQKLWKAKNPRAVRLIYQYDVEGIEKLQQEISQTPSKKAEVLGTQNPILPGVKPYGITADGEAVPLN